MTSLHIDASIGCAGDMLLAALVDAGADRARVSAAVAAVLPGATVGFAGVQRAGLRALQATVSAPDTSPFHTWRELRPALTASLPPEIAAGAVAVFAGLAQAEGEVHGIVPDEVHFHEVGAWDSICDVVGGVAALLSLHPETITAGPVATGSGTVTGAHGTLPVPVPAVVALLAAARAPVLPGPASFEACTPTGAALLGHFVDHWQAGPTGVIEGSGVGAGTADPAGFANTVRVFVTADAPVPGSAVMLETNVDDIDPRLWPGIQRELLAAGASDAWLTPIQMKKGRPATTLSVLCRPDQQSAVARLVFRLTPAIGLRVLPVGKLAAERTMATVAVAGCPIAVKIASWEGAIVNVQPEWEDVATAARELGEPEKTILARAQAAAAELWPNPRNP